MSNKSNSKRNKLSLNLFESNLKRHPSVKCLFDEEGKKKNPSDSKDEYLLLNIDNKSSNDTSNNYGEEEIEEKEISCKKKERKLSIPVQINRVEEKIVDSKETFYVEMDEKNKNEILSNNKLKNNDKVGMPLSYGFNESQKKFDKDVTEAIFKGKTYSEIEEKFSKHLKK
jgi:hypothetical protein